MADVKTLNQFSVFLVNKPGVLAQVGLRFDGHHLRDRGGEVREVGAVARAHVEHAAGEPGQRLAAMLRFLGRLVAVHENEQAREQGIVYLAHG